MRIWRRSQKSLATSPDREDSADAELSPDEIESLLNDAANGDPVAQCKAGRRFLRHGDELQAMNLFRHSAYQGHEPAWSEIGAMCGNEGGVPGTNEDVAKWYIRVADTGNRTAQLALAGIYREGLGVEPDQVESTRLYRLSAEQGDLDAQFHLSLRYEAGKGVRADAAEAMTWLRRAASSGHPDARARLDRKSCYGIDLKADVEELTRLLTGRAKQGDLNKISAIAEAYSTGSPCGEDLEKAAKWFRRITELSTAEGLRLYARILASQADETAHVAFLAHIYFSLAAAAGHQSAASESKLLESRIPSRDVKKSRAITRMCRRAVDRNRGSRRRHRRSRRSSGSSGS